MAALRSDMNRRIPKNEAYLIRVDVLERLLVTLHEMDQKLDHLIRNLPRFNGRHLHGQSTLNHFPG